MKHIPTSKKNKKSTKYKKYLISNIKKLIKFNIQYSKIYLSSLSLITINIIQQI